MLSPAEHCIRLACISGSDADLDHTSYMLMTFLGKALCGWKLYKGAYVSMPTYASIAFREQLLIHQLIVLVQLH